MITAAFVLLSCAAVLFVVRLLIGPTVPDRVVALDGLLVTLVSGILVASAAKSSAVVMVSALIVALVSFIATGVMARYVERRGG